MSDVSRASRPGLSSAAPVGEEIFQLAPPEFLVKKRLLELASVSAQWAWATTHARPRSARQVGAPAYWPCTFCDKKRGS